MITVEQWALIRHMHFHQQMSLRKISRTLQLNWRTVKQAVQSDAPPKYHRQKVPPSILEPFKVEIRQLVESTGGQIPSSVIYRKLSERCDLRELPRYTGSYDTLWRYVRQLKEELSPPEAYLELETPAGFDAQCDWCKVPLKIADQPIELSMFVLKLSYSRYRYARLYRLERQECFFDGHVRAFELFCGVPKRVTYDNLKTAVLKVLCGRNRIEQEAFVAFRGQFPFEANFTAVGKGNEKGKVESEIRYVRNHAFGLTNSFATIDDANSHLYQWLIDDAKRVHTTHKQVVTQLFDVEKSHLQPLPQPMPKACRTTVAKVNKFSFVNFETNRYSVPTKYVYQTLVVKAFVDKVVIVSDDQVVATHRRLFERHGQQINPHHFLALLEKKARALDEAVVMKSLVLDAVFDQLKVALSKRVANANREFVRILRLTEKHPLDRVTSAVELALLHNACDFDSINNIVLQLSQPLVSIDSNDCLIHHPHLADVSVPPSSLSDYDRLLNNLGGSND